MRSFEDINLSLSLAILLPCASRIPSQNELQPEEAAKVIARWRATGLSALGRLVAFDASVNVRPLFPKIRAVLHLNLLFEYLFCEEAPLC